MVQKIEKYIKFHVLGTFWWYLDRYFGKFSKKNDFSSNWTTEILIPLKFDEIKNHGTLWCKTTLKFKYFVKKIELLTKYRELLANFMKKWQTITMNHLKKIEMPYGNKNKRSKIQLNI